MIRSSLACLPTWLQRHPARAGALAGWIQQGASLGSALLLVPVATSLLSPADAGIWFVFQGLTAMLLLVDLGFGFAVARQVAFTAGKRQGTAANGFIDLASGWDGIAQLFQLTRRLYLFLALVSGLVGLGMLELVSSTGQLSTIVSQSTRSCWYALVIAVMLMILAGRQAAFLIGLGAVYQVRLLSAAYQGIAAIGAATAAIIGWGLPGMGAAYAVVAAMHYLGVLCIRKRAAPKLREVVVPPLPSGSLGSLCKASLPIGGVNIFGSLMYTAQTPLLGLLLGPDKVAPFFLAQKIAFACNQAVLHTVSPQLPFFTRQYGAGEFGGALRLMDKTILRTVLLALIGSVMFFLLSPTVAGAFLPGSEYLNPSPLGLMAIDMFLLTVSVPYAWFVLNSGKNPFVVPTIVGGVLSLILSVFLAPRLGVSGIPLSSIIAGLATSHWFACWRGLTLRHQLKSAVFRRESQMRPTA